MLKNALVEVVDLSDDDEDLRPTHTAGCGGQSGNHRGLKLNGGGRDDGEIIVLDEWPELSAGQQVPSGNTRALEKEEELLRVSSDHGTATCQRWRTAGNNQHHSLPGNGIDIDAMARHWAEQVMKGRLPANKDDLQAHISKNLQAQGGGSGNDLRSPQCQPGRVPEGNTIPTSNNARTLTWQGELGFQHGHHNNLQQQLIPDPRIVNQPQQIPRGIAPSISHVVAGPGRQAEAEEADVGEGVLTVPLMKHQRIALAWMSGRERGYPCGGILADDQGLGKTLTTIALILHSMNNYESGRQGGNKEGETKRDSGSGEGKNGSGGVTVVDLDEEDEVGKEEERNHEADGGRKRKRQGGTQGMAAADGTAGGKEEREEVADGRGEAGGIEGVDEFFNTWLSPSSPPPPPPATCSEPQPQSDRALVGDVLDGGTSSRLQGGVSVSVLGSGSRSGSGSVPAARQLTRLPARRPSGGTLVVCPTTVLRQWARELQSRVGPARQLSVLVYHGPSRIKSEGELASYDVVLTTYAIATMDGPQPQQQKKGEGEGGRGGGKGKVRGEEDDGGGGEEGKKGKKRGKGGEGLCLGGPLGRVSWHRVVLDEAHMIKNRNTQVRPSNL